MLWAELCPPPTPTNAYFEALTPGTSECDCVFGDGAFKVAD